ncbi:MAG: hypothetical protein R3F59_27855 [Myxococcota bacterium]
MILAALSAGALASPFDPAPGLFRSRAARSENLDCERISTEAAVRRYPGLVQPERPRGDFVERDVVVCTERLARPGLRDPRDEAILSTLEDTVAEIAGAVEALRPDLAGRTWLVEAYDDSPRVTSKVSFAAKNALMTHGLTVSDRTPALSAGDIEVLGRMPPDQAFTGACRRYADSGALREQDVLLAVTSRDPRETVLHAGICEGGLWTWLQ